jgi:hypothetical protein
MLAMSFSAALLVAHTYTDQRSIMAQQQQQAQAIEVNKGHRRSVTGADVEESINRAVLQYMKLKKTIELSKLEYKSTTDEMKFISDGIKNYMDLHNLSAVLGLGDGRYQSRLFNQVKQPPVTALMLGTAISAYAKGTGTTINVWGLTEYLLAEITKQSEFKEKFSLTNMPKDAKGEIEAKQAVAIQQQILANKRAPDTIRLQVEAEERAAVRKAAREEEKRQDEARKRSGGR